MASRKVGVVTTSSTGGAGVAGALSIIIVWLISLTGLQVPGEIASALTTVLGALGALAGGWLVPGESAGAHVAE